MSDIRFIETQGEWEAFWEWFKNSLPNSMVDHKTETRPFKTTCEIAIYDWYHYKRVNNEYITNQNKETQL